MLCLAFAMAESRRVHMQMSPPPVAAATISLAIGFGAALSTFWLSFTAELDPAILELQTYSSTYLELALQLSGGLHANDHVFMGTPLLDVNTADPSDLATLERLDTTPIERITTWLLPLNVLLLGGLLSLHWTEHNSNVCLLQFKQPTLHCTGTQVTSALDSSARSLTVWRRGWLSRLMEAIHLGSES